MFLSGFQRIICRTESVVDNCNFYADTEAEYGYCCEKKDVKYLEDGEKVEKPEAEEDFGLREVAKNKGQQAVGQDEIRKTPADDDVRVEKDGTTVLIDPVSYNYLMGSVIDYVETLEASQFVINNPNATSSCGCGNSFSL